MNESPNLERGGAAVGKTRRLAREAIPLFLIYLFLSFLLLPPKLRVTPAWFDGTLDHNDAALFTFQYANDEQSRLFQFLIPEFFIHVCGMNNRHAYIFQRWLFVAIAFLAFHCYQRRWFSRGLSFAGVCLLAAMLPFSFVNDLQESAPFLMFSFVVALWTIRDGPSWSFALALLIGALNNETSLALPIVYFANKFSGWRPRTLWNAIWQTLAVSLPAFAYTASIRYVTRDRPHLGGAWHWSENLAGIWNDLHASPLDYYAALYLSTFFIFNVLWLYAFFAIPDKPKFMRATLWLVPAMIIPHLITGMILEVRQMVPLGFVIIPAAFWWLFPESRVKAHAETSELA